MAQVEMPGPFLLPNEPVFRYAKSLQKGDFVMLKSVLFLSVSFLSLVGFADESHLSTKPISGTISGCGNITNGTFMLPPNTAYRIDLNESKIFLGDKEVKPENGLSATSFGLYYVIKSPTEIEYTATVPMDPRNGGRPTKLVQVTKQLVENLDGFQNVTIYRVEMQKTYENYYFVNTGTHSHWYKMEMRYKSDLSKLSIRFNPIENEQQMHDLPNDCIDQKELDAVIGFQNIKNGSALPNACTFNFSPFGFGQVFRLTADVSKLARKENIEIQGSIYETPSDDTDRFVRAYKRTGRGDIYPTNFVKVVKDVQGNEWYEYILTETSEDYRLFYNSKLKLLQMESLVTDDEARRQGFGSTRLLAAQCATQADLGVETRFTSYDITGAGAR